MSSVTPVPIDSCGLHHPNKGDKTLSAKVTRDKPPDRRTRRQIRVRGSSLLGSDT